MAAHTQDHAAKTAPHDAQRSPKPLPGAPPVDDNEVELSFNLVGITHRIRTTKVDLHTAPKAHRDAKAADTRVDTRNDVPIDATGDANLADDGLSIYDGYAEVLGRWLLAEAATSVSVSPVVRPEQPPVDDTPKSGQANLTDVRLNA
jgi:hypothetical protein